MVILTAQFPLIFVDLFTFGLGNKNMENSPSLTGIATYTGFDTLRAAFPEPILAFA